MDQTITINGIVFIVTVNSANGVTKITVPSIRNPSQPSDPFEVTYDPAGTIANVYDIYALLVRLGLIPGGGSMARRR